jgi:hypothetical protein
MTKLPHSRPRPRAARSKPRPGARARSTARKPAVPRAGASVSTARRPTPKTPANKAFSADSARGARAATAAPRRPFPSSEPPPGLPRIALDGAVEAAKFPIKVGAGITFKALDAVARGLRRR